MEGDCLGQSVGVGGIIMPFFQSRLTGGQGICRGSRVLADGEAPKLAGSVNKACKMGGETIGSKMK